MTTTANRINTLAAFCGRRDVKALTRDALKEQFGFEQADVMVFFGGSILCGGDVLARAMEEGVAAHYIISGGAGHTTGALREQAHKVCPEIWKQNLEAETEAEIFAAYLKSKTRKVPDALERESTNCGNNITNVLALLKERGLPANRMIIAQDATMQQRMDAVLRKFAPDTVIVNYATYQAQVKEVDGQLRFTRKILGMWEMDRYLSLLMGEIPRLTNDREGYGPKGKDYLAAVTIPREVREAFDALKAEDPGRVRRANPQFASRA